MTKLEKNDGTTARDRPDEISGVTSISRGAPEMIEAGAIMLERWEDFADSDQLVVWVYRAMRAASPEARKP